MIATLKALRELGASGHNKEIESKVIELNQIDLFNDFTKTGSILKNIES